MKFTTQASVLALALGVSAGAEPPTLVPRDGPSLVERDLATVTSVVNTVSDKLSALDTAVNGFSGDVSGLTSAAGDLSSSITSGTTAIQGTSELTLNDALALQSIVSGLQDKGNALVNDMAAKKSALESAGLCDIILQQSQQLDTDSQALIAAVVSKVPQEARAIAQNLAGGFSSTLQQNEATFAQGNCTNSGTASSGGAGGGGGSSSSSSESSSPSSSAAGGVGGGASATGSGSGATATGTTRPSGTSTTRPSGTTTAGPSGTTTPTQVTAAAALNGAAVPVGGLAAVVAALLI